MFSTVTKALIGTPVGGGAPILLMSSDVVPDVETAMSSYRTQLTVMAALPGMPDDTHAEVMATIRSLRIIDVRVDQVVTM